jgi:hypothetical protein
MDPQLHSREKLPEYGMETFNIAIQYKFQSQTSVGRIMLTVILDTQGQILE